jgi:hypothetical protein
MDCRVKPGNGGSCVSRARCGILHAASQNRDLTEHRRSDWPHSSFHRYVERGLLAADWGGDMRDIQGSFGE